jgi:hypothetical protein
MSQSNRFTLRQYIHLPSLSNGQDSSSSALSVLTSKLPSTVEELKLSGYHLIVDAVFDYGMSAHTLATRKTLTESTELSRNHILAQASTKSQWRRAMVLFLAAIPDEVLFGLIHGNLAQKHNKSKKDLLDAYGNPPSSDHASSSKNTDWYKNTKRVAPGHYVRFLVDRNTGLPPTPNELLQVISIMRQYIKVPFDVKLGDTIDGASRTVRKGTARQTAEGKFFFFCREKKGLGWARSQVSCYPEQERRAH